MEASVIHAPAGPRRSTGARLLRLRSDDQLVALFRLGYDDAFGAIHDRYRQRLLAYTRQMLARSGLDAEDVLQDTFLRAYAALRQDDRPVTLRAWLYRVAHNRCIDHLRRPEPPMAEIFQLQRGLTLDPPAETERRESLRRLVDDLQRLPEQQRSALLMRELEGLSYAELADALDTTVPAVKSLLVRARCGLVEAGEARDTDCVEIRGDLDAALGRGVRASARSRRHLRDCAGCREYRAAARRVHNGLHAVSPGGGPLAALAKLLGLGGAGSAAGASASAGGSAAVVGTGATATATKLVAVVCAAAVVGGGAAEVQHYTAPPAHHARRAHASAAARASTGHAVAARPLVVVAPRLAGDALGSRPRTPAPAHPAKAAKKQSPAPDAAPGGASAPADPVPAAGATPASPLPADAGPTPQSAAAQTGGALAPDEPPPAADPQSQGSGTAPDGAAAGASTAGREPAATAAPATVPAG
ncbi:MAG: RNA polymerase sigma factor [Solirubrobacteraceae bacterium]